MLILIIARHCFSGATVFREKPLNCDELLEPASCSIQFDMLGSLQGR